MKRFIFIALTLCLFTAGVLAQATSGSLVGTVSGPDGVLPGATVSVKDKTEATDGENKAGDGVAEDVTTGYHRLHVAVLQDALVKSAGNAECLLLPGVEVRQCPGQAGGEKDRPISR